jgi:hypothetical protein
MASQAASKGPFSLKAYVGDNKTLLAFNFTDPSAAKGLAGFTIQCQPPGKPSYYLWNELQFPDPAVHAQMAGEPPQSTANAPIQKYRWVHVTGEFHQGLVPATGNYTYTVTPRYFDANQHMKPLDASLSGKVIVPVGPFKKASLSLGFTRGYMQSEAFLHHFGNTTRLVPANRDLQFSTSAQAGSNKGQNFTYADIYDWMGASARQQVFDILSEVLSDNSLHLDVFAYDLDEPDVVGDFLKLAAQGRIRIILDSAQLHVTHVDSKTKKTVVPLEDTFTAAFQKQKTGNAAIVRGCFARYSHDKVFIVSKNGTPVKVLTGSTNFSVNGLYVNANHVLVFDDPAVAAEYAQVFAQSWQILSTIPKNGKPSQAAANAFSALPLATKAYTGPTSAPKMSINFSPHTAADAGKILGGIVNRVNQEASAGNGSVLFAVMQLTGSNTPVYNALNAVHGNAKLYSYGISDAPQGTFLYSTGSADGVLVTGKPGQTTLPAPFDQVPIPPGHEIHDKFVVCGINGKDPVVWCGSSNLASGGEAANGDNLLEIHDADVATAFAIEALLLVDHYAFLDRYAKAKKQAATSSGAKKAPAKAAAKGAAANTAQANAKSPAKSSVKKTAATKTVAKTTAAKKSAAKKIARRAPAKKVANRRVAMKKAVTKKKPAAKHPAKSLTARAGR